MRGSKYLGLRGYVEAIIPRGMSAIVEALPEGPYRSFAGQSFVAGDWYDALPIRSLTEIIAKLEGQSWSDSVRAQARSSAERDLGVFGRVRGMATSPEQVVAKLSNAALQNFDFGEAEVVQAERGQSRIVFHQIPQPLGPWFLPTMEGYAAVVIGNSGGKHAQISGRLIPKGQRDDVGLVEVRVDMSWSR